LMSYFCIVSKKCLRSYFL